MNARNGTVKTNANGKAADGFKVHAMDAAGEVVSNVTVDWLIMPEVQ